MADTPPADSAPGVADMVSHLLERRLVRYAIAAVGPISTSATQFVVSLVMLRTVSPADFAVFTFLLVASQLSWGCWSALFCAPLPVLLTTRNAHDQSEGETTLLTASLVGTVGACFVFAVTAALLGLPAMATACFAGYGAAALIRVVARAYAYVHGQQLRAVASDVSFSVGTLAVLTLSLRVFYWEAQVATYAALLVGSILGLLPIVASAACKLASPVDLDCLRRYGATWRTQTRWALLGVITTEATANAHVYLITFLEGPHAFAPIAASALLLRPVNVAQNALADFEKPQMARLIGAADWSGLRSSKRYFLGTLVVVWAVSSLAATALFAINARLVFSAAYDVHFVAIATTLWMTVAAIRLCQVPASTALGAAGEFRNLAVASIGSSIVSIILTAALIVAAGALLSILGVAAGAVIFFVLTERYYRRWLRGATGRPA